MPTETLSGRRTLADRILAKSVVAPNGCRLWTGHQDRDGYGRIGNGKTAGRQPRPCLVHREAYKVFVGPLADGMTIDHTCHTNDLECAGGSDCTHRRCVEPSHLEQVTFEENTRRREARLDRERCRRGHEFTEENTRPRADGGRDCRACAALTARTRRARAKILPSEAVPRPAVSHIANQSTVGVDSPAGDSGTADLGSAGAAAQVEPPLHTLRDHLLRVARGSRS